MKIFIDTEFNSYKGELISLALVAEDGREWYGVRFWRDPHEWVAKNVITNLKQDPQPDEELLVSLNEYLGKFNELHIIADWPTDIAHFCNFIEFQGGERIGPNRMIFEVRNDFPGTSETSLLPHNALADARALAASYKAHNVNGDL